MSIKSEADFEQHIRELISSRITSKHPAIYALDSKKSVDIVVCRDKPRPRAFFLEVKLFNPTHGRLATGGAEGGGFQPEVLRRMPIYFERHLRWVLGHIDSGADRVWLLTSAELRSYLSGGAIDKKYNNIQRKVFDLEDGLDEAALVSQLEQWLLS